MTRTHLYAFGERGTTSIPASYTRHVCFLFSREVFSCCACLKVEEPVLAGSLSDTLHMVEPRKWREWRESNPHFQFQLFTFRVETGAITLPKNGGHDGTRTHTAFQPITSQAMAATKITPRDHKVVRNVGNAPT